MRTLLKSGIEFKRLELPKLTNHNPCNPSIILRDGHLSCVYRGCNHFLRQHGYQRFYGSWTTPVSDSQNYIAKVSKDLECLGADLIEDRHSRARNDCLDGIQDLRIFNWKGEVFAVGSGANFRPHLEKNTDPAVYTMVLGKLNNNKLDIVASFNSGRPTEKNWMPWVIDDVLHFVYSPYPFIVLRYDLEKNSLKNVYFKQDGLPSKSRGGSCMIPFGKDFLGILHTKDVSDGKMIYAHRAFIASREFEVVKVSSEFSFEGEDVEFCAGVVLEDDNLYFSYGIFDEKAVVLKMYSEKIMDFIFS